MIQIEELKNNVKDLQGKLSGIENSLDIPKLTEELASLNEQQHKPDFWDDVKTAQQVSQRAKNIEDKMNDFRKLQQRLNDVSDLLTMCEDDESLLEETANELAALDTAVNEMHVSALLSGKFDANNAILTLHAGAGGTEAQDWVQMLYRMYTRYAERRGYKIEVLRQLIADHNWDKTECLMIGDTFYDAEGAAANGVDFLAVTYGFGTNKELVDGNPVAMADSPKQIAELLL